MSKDQNPDFFEYALIGIEAEYEAAVEAAKKRRDERIAQAHEWWQGIGGTVMKNGAKTNGSNGSSVPKEIIQMFIDEVILDPSVEVVTQTEIKDRILANRHVPAENLNSLRVTITTLLNSLVSDGYLELVERAKAGQPNVYRKTRKTESIF